MNVERDWLLVRPTTCKSVIDAVAGYCQLTPAAITGKRRDATFVSARHLAMWLCRELMGLSYPQIGQAFQRHHTTVIYAVMYARTRHRLAGRDPHAVWNELNRGDRI